MSSELSSLIVKIQVITSVAWVFLIGLLASLQVPLQEKTLRSGMFVVSWIGVISGGALC